MERRARLARTKGSFLLSLGVCCALFFLAFCTLCVGLAAQEAPVYYGYIKLGMVAISQSGDAASMRESYNLSNGPTLSKVILNGKLAKNSMISLDIENVTEHQLTGSLEFATSGVLDIRFDGRRLRYLQPGAGTPEFAREFKGVTANLTPQRWLTIYGGLSSQDKHGDRIALLTDGLDFPGTIYDYSTETRNIGSEIRWKGRSVEVGYEWREFKSDRNSLLNRGNRRLRAFVHGPVVGGISLSASYIEDKSIFDETGDLLHMRSYSGTVTLVPAKSLSVSGHVNHKNTGDDLTGISTRLLTAGVQGSVRLHTSLTTEAGYEYTRRTEMPLVISAAGDKREVSSNAFLVGMTERFSDRTKLILRYRMRTSDRTKYEGLTGPFDTDNLISKFEGWVGTYVQYSLAFEDRERSNDELMSSGKTRGFTVFANLTPPLGQYPPSLRLSGSMFRSKFTEQRLDFLTDNILLSARLNYTLLKGLNAEAGITHVDVRKDLNIRKDIVAASLEYEFVSGYAVGLKYDLFSYDDLLTYRGNYAANVVTLSLSRKFGSDYSEE
jgi:hypothetical protein